MCLYRITNTFYTHHHQLRHYLRALFIFLFLFGIKRIKLSQGETMIKILFLFSTLISTLDAMSPPKILGFGRSKKKEQRRKEEEQKKLDLAKKIAKKSPKQKEAELAKRIINFMQHNNIKQLKAFAASGTNFNVCSPSGQLPLCVAVLKANLDYVQVLIDGGAKVDEQNGLNEKHYPGQSPLHILMQLMEISKWSEILEQIKKAKVVNPNVQDLNGRVPLHFAISAIDEDDESKKPTYRKNCIEGISYLLSVGADPVIEDKGGWKAMETTDPDIIKLFKSHGVEVTHSMQTILEQEKVSEVIDDKLRKLEKERRKLELLKQGD